MNDVDSSAALEAGGTPVDAVERLVDGTSKINLKTNENRTDISNFCGNSILMTSRKNFSHGFQEIRHFVDCSREHRASALGYADVVVVD